VAGLKNTGFKKLTGRFVVKGLVVLLKA